MLLSAFFSYTYIIFYKTLNEITDNLYKFMRSLPFPERWIAEVHKNFTDDRIFDSFIKDNICVAQKKLKEAFSLRVLSAKAFFSSL